MINSEHCNNRLASGGFIVRGPRLSDTLGNTLRDAYIVAHDLPDELSTILVELDDLTKHR